MNISSKTITAFVMSTLLIVAFLSLTSCGVFAWLAGTKALPDNLGIGYYRDFDIARKAIEASPCADSIEYSRHEDVTLEDFHFLIRTRSGLFVRLWFYEGMDVAAVCSKPDGLVVLHRLSHSVDQVYSVAERSTDLGESGVQVASVNDLLCNMDELSRFFEAKSHNDAIGRITHNYEASSRYLYVEILGGQGANDYVYTRVR